MSVDLHERPTYVARYAEHSSRLQTWIGAYGAGLASALVYQFRTAIADARAQSGIGDLAARLRIEDDIFVMHYALGHSLRLIAAALGAQILLLLLNKTSQFAIAHMDDNASKWTRSDRAAEWFSDQYWFDLLCDLVAIGLLVRATFYATSALGLS